MHTQAARASYLLPMRSERLVGTAYIIPFGAEACDQERRLDTKMACRTVRRHLAVQGTQTITTA